MHIYLAAEKCLISPIVRIIVIRNNKTTNSTHYEIRTGNMPRLDIKCFERLHTKELERSVTVRDVL